MLKPHLHEIAAQQLLAGQTLVLQGLPLVGKRYLVARLAALPGYRQSYFSAESGSLQKRPRPPWLPGNAPESGCANLSILEKVESLPEALLWQQCLVLTQQPHDRLVVVSSRELVCPLERSQLLTLRPLAPAEVAQARERLGVQNVLSSASWMDLAEHLGCIGGLLAFAAEQLVRHPLPLALEAIHIRLAEWTQSVCSQLPETAMGSLAVLGGCAFPLAQGEGDEWLDQQGCLEGIEPLRQHFLLEEGPGLSVLEPLRGRPEALPGRGTGTAPGATPQPRSGSQARQCQRLWQQAFGLPQPDGIKEAEAELKHGNWTEARRLYRFADLTGAPDGWAGCILTTLLLGQQRKASEAMERPGPWRDSTRYPYAGLLALHAYLRGEPQESWNWLHQLPAPLPWCAHYLGALLWESQRQPQRGHQQLTHSAPQCAVQQAWQLWIKGKLHLVDRDPTSAQTCWDQALQIFAEESHLNGLALVQVERLQLDYWLQRPTSPACLQSWLCLAQQLGNAETEVRLRLLRGRWQPERAAGLAHAIERIGHLQVHFERVWLQSRKRCLEAPQPARGELFVHYFGSLRLKGPLGEIHEQDWPTRKAAVLFCLLGQAGKPVADEALMAQLWPEASLQQGRTRLRTALHHLRLAIKKVAGQTAAEVIKRSRKSKTVALALSFESDLDRLKKLLPWARKATPQQVIPRLWEFAEAHPERIFLHTFRDDWTDPIRLEAASLWCELLSLLSHNEFLQQRPQGAERAARMGLEVDEFDENLLALVVQALQQQGRHSESLQWAAERARAYQREFGHWPGSLARIVRDQDVAEFTLHSRPPVE